MRVLWVSMVLGLIAGCGSERGPATKYYKLEIPAAPAPVGPSAPASLQIETFQTADLLRQGRIVYRPSPVEVGYYEYHRWAEPPHDTLTKAFADQLKRRRVFQSVEISDSGKKADYLLRGSIDRLQEVDYSGAVRVQVSISAELEDSSGHQIWSSASSSESVVSKSDVQAVVAAMSAASQKSIAELVSDVAKFVQLNRLTAASSEDRSR